MPHTFPPKKFLNAEVPLAEDLNRAFLPLAAKIAGRLNEHDINAASKFAFANLAPSCYYQGHHVLHATDIGWVTGVHEWAKQGGVAGSPTFTLLDSYAWQTVAQDSGAQTPLSLSVSSGEDTLILFAILQHASWLGRAGANPPLAPSDSTPMRVQYALRVNGQVLDETVTGAVIIPDRPLQEMYKVSEDAQSYDWRHIQYVQDTIGINAFVHPARMFAVVQVPSGSHTVDVAARRVPNLQYKVDEDGEGVYIQCFTRRLFVLRIKGNSPHSSDVPTLNVPAFSEADTLSAASLGTQRFHAIRDLLNNLTDDTLERGALHHDHLPSVVAYPTATVAQPVSITPAVSVPITTTYGGYGVDTGVEWTIVSDGGVNMRTSGQMDFTANPGLLIVTANVQVLRVGIAASTSTQAVGALALRIKNSAGTTTVLGETEVYVNSHNPSAAAAKMLDIEDDLPLLWVVNTATLSAPNQVLDYIEIVGSVWDGGGGGAAVVMRTQRASLSVLLLKGISLVG